MPIRTNRNLRRTLAVMVVSAAVTGFGIRRSDAQVQDDPKHSRATQQGEDIGAGGAHPLQEIGAIMSDVRTRLHQRDTSRETLAMQRRIIERLSKMIDTQAQSTSQTTSAGNQAQRTRPATGELPGSQDGPGTTPSTAAASDNAELLLRQIWGHLPDQVRRSVETPLHEKFLPQYDDLIQDYFKRLANENPK